METRRIDIELHGVRDLQLSQYNSDFGVFALLAVLGRESNPLPFPQKSDVVLGQGASPTWDAAFIFTIADDFLATPKRAEEIELSVQFFAKKKHVPKSYIGEARIPLAALLGSPATIVTPYTDSREAISLGLRAARVW